MKILIVRSYGSVMNVGTYNTQEIGLATALMKKGIQADIVLFSGSKPSYTQKWPCQSGGDITIYWLTGKSILKHGIMPEVFDIASKYDLLWVNEFNQYTSWKLIKTVEKPCVVYHGPYKQNFSLLRGLREKLFETLFDLGKAKKTIQVFTKSDLAKEHLQDIGFCKIDTIGVGLDYERFNIDKDPNLAQYGIKDTDKLLVYIGSIDRRRNIRFLLDVLRKLSEREEQVKLLMIGKPDESYWDSCQEFITKNGLGEKIIHIERLGQDYLPRVYKRADIFLFPTLYDIFGMVLMEAMYFGVPVVSSLNGGSSTMIDSGENGYVLPLDSTVWADTIHMLLKDKELCMKIADAEQATIKKYFSWEAISDKVISKLEEISG